MRVVNLHAENVKRLRVADVTPDPKKNVVIVGGKNAQGKSSLIDSMGYAIGGKNLIPEEPLRRGADKGHVTVDLGEIKVTRTFTEKGSDLKVFAADGSKVSGPQTILDTLYSSVTFDPLEFASKKPEEQAAILRNLVGLDFTDLNAKEKNLFEKRTEKNRDVKRLEGVFSGKKFHHGAPKALVSVAELTAQLNEENAKATAREEVNNQATAWGKEAEKHRQEIKRLEDLLEKEKAALAEADKAYDLACEKFENMPEPNTAALLEQIANADAVNQKVRDNAEYQKAKDELEEAQTEAEGLTLGIQKVRDEKERLISEAKFPVAGLGFGDAGVLFNGLPFEQASAAERLRVSVAIGAALNPKLKVLFVRDGSLLDDDSMQLLAEIAEEHDCQVWVERVGDKDECAVIIEDGMVRE